MTLIGNFGEVEGFRNWNRMEICRAVPSYDPLDDRLDRMHLEPAIQPRPGSGLGNPALCSPNLSEDRFLDAAAGSDLGGGEENTPGISARGNRTGDGVPVACHRSRI
jgi:hypothetical protein